MRRKLKPLTEDAFTLISFHNYTTAMFFTDRWGRSWAFGWPFSILHKSAEFKSNN